MKAKYTVVRTSNGEYMGTFDTEAEAEECKREEEGQDARLVERGWIAQPATYTVVKR